jgi:hypothetical protein
LGNLEDRTMKKQSDKWQELACELKDSILEYWKFESDKKNRLKQQRVVRALQAVGNLQQGGLK